ncbi:MAG: hypothetical protein DME07_10670 [Candidatus Rokuibacteriota bacterium]|nr:MAG: hypothetical protein DME07_10670 [Candidatus Rokubacteria bacterium]
MPLQTRYLFSAAMNVHADKDAIFNEVYDQEHVPSLLKVPGVIAVARFKSEPVTMGADQRRLGQGGRGRALAGPSSALHLEPAPRDVPPHLLRGRSRSR